ARIAHRDAFALGFVQGPLLRELGDDAHWLADTVPICATIDWQANFDTHRDRTAAELGEIKRRPVFLRDLVARTPDLRETAGLADGSAWPVCVAVDAEPPAGHALALVVARDGSASISFESSVIPEARARALAHQIEALLESVERSPNASVSSLAIMSEEA